MAPGGPSFFLDHLANPRGLPGGGAWEGLRFSNLSGQSDLSLWLGVGVGSLTAIEDFPFVFFVSK